MDRSMQYLFVGERKSPTALLRGWSWEDGRLAAKQLFDALDVVGVDPQACLFRNAFDPGSLSYIREKQQDGWLVVAMGAKAQRELERHAIPFRPMVHPAARGAIRRKDRYTAHVQEVLA